MKNSEEEIEDILRAAPKPKAPATLRTQLAAQIRLAGTSKDPAPTTWDSGFAGWLHRWWPVLVPASVSVVCMAAIVSQELRISALHQRNLELADQRASLQNTAATVRTFAAQPEGAPSAALTAEQQEIARLKDRSAQLSNEVARLEKMQVENENLRKQPATPGGFSETELTALSQAREKAMSISCVNNLKQIGLAAKIWALDNKDTFPPNFLSMSNELNTPKILVCPAETNRQVAATFTAYTDANCSYELLTPSENDTEPDRVLTRCPLHGHVGLCDGSVQSEVGKKHPEWLVERNQKLYLDRGPAARPVPPIPGGTAPELQR